MYWKTFEMKIAVVTSSIGTNRLLDPIPFDGVDYHAFVDDSASNNKWITHPTISFSSDPTYFNRRNAKLYKILPFAFLPEYQPDRYGSQSSNWRQDFQDPDNRFIQNSYKDPIYRGKIGLLVLKTKI